jgi:hypothetical protein
MIQEIIVILAVAGCAIWLAVQVYRFLKPRPGKMCGGGCCDESSAKKSPSAVASASAGGERVMMISSDDMRARIKARKA